MGVGTPQTRYFYRHAPKAGTVYAYADALEAWQNQDDLARDNESRVTRLTEELATLRTQYDELAQEYLRLRRVQNITQADQANTRLKKLQAQLREDKNMLDYRSKEAISDRKRATRLMEQLDRIKDSAQYREDKYFQSGEGRKFIAANQSKVEACAQAGLKASRSLAKTLARPLAKNLPNINYYREKCEKKIVASLKLGGTKSY